MSSSFPYRTPVYAGLGYTALALSFVASTVLFTLCLWKRNAQPLKSRGYMPFLFIIFWSIIDLRDLLKANTIGVGIFGYPAVTGNARCVIHYLFGISFAQSAFMAKLFHTLSTECKIRLYRNKYFFQQGTLSAKERRKMSFLRVMSSQFTPVVMVVGFLAIVELIFVIVVILGTTQRDKYTFCHGVLSGNTLEETVSRYTTSIILALYVLYFIWDVCFAKRKYFVAKIRSIVGKGDTTETDHSVEMSAASSNDKTANNDEDSSSAGGTSSLAARDAWLTYDPYYLSVELYLFTLAMIISIIVAGAFPAFLRNSVLTIITQISRTGFMVGSIALFPLLLTFRWEKRKHKVMEKTDVAKDLNIIISDPKALAAFKAFLKSHYCLENILFLLEVRKLKEVADPKAHAEKIIASFIVEHSTLDLNISLDMRREVISHVRSGQEFNPNIFLAIESHIEGLLHGKLAEFRTSANYKKLVKKEGEMFANIL